MADPAKPAPAPEPVKPPAPANAEPALPAKIRMNVLYGFYDEHGTLREWKEGDVISDPAVIKLLAEHEPAEDKNGHPRKRPFDVIA